MLFTKASLAIVALALSMGMAAAGPVPAVEANTDVVARGMLGSNNMLVSWESVPNRRSPLDPELSELDKRIVYNPKIEQPAAGTIWCAGSQQEVTWDTSAYKQEYGDLKGTIVLGQHKANNEGGLNLQSSHPLAKDFSLSSGKTTVKVPSTTAAGDRYIIVLMGDSGNASKEFSIKPAGQCGGAKEQSNGDDSIADFNPLKSNFAKSIEEAVELPSA